MSDDYQPRKNDALVEPMFEALGGPPDECGDECGSDTEGAPGPSPEPERSRGLWWVLWIAAVLVVAWILFELLGCSA
jgi:hypothetical protein